MCWKLPRVPGGSLPASGPEGGAGGPGQRGEQVAAAWAALLPSGWEGRWADPGAPAQETAQADPPLQASLAVPLLPEGPLPWRGVVAMQGRVGQCRAEAKP